MKNAADSGKDPVEAFNNAGSGGATKTPTGRKRGRPAGATPASGRSRGGGTPATGRSTTTTAKPKRSTAKKASYVEPATTTDKDESAGSVDYDALDDDSPTGHLAKKTRTTPIKTALPPRRMSGAAAPAFHIKTEALDEIFEVRDRLPSPSPMAPASSIAAAATSASAINSNSNAGNGGDYFGNGRADRAASEYHTPEPEFPRPATQSQSQAMSFDGGVSTSFASSTTNIFGGGGSNNHTNNGFMGNQNGYSQQQSQLNNTQQSQSQTVFTGHVHIVSDDEDNLGDDDHPFLQSVSGPGNRNGGGNSNFSNQQPSFTAAGASMTLGMGMMGGNHNNGGGAGAAGNNMGSFYVEEDLYEI